MLKHTPGPWRIEHRSLGSKWPIIQGANWSGEVATVYGESGEEEADGNALLISLAPDMARLLRELCHPEATEAEFRKSLEEGRALFRQVLDA